MDMQSDSVIGRKARPIVPFVIGDFLVGEYGAEKNLAIHREEERFAALTVDLPRLIEKMFQ